MKVNLLALISAAILLWPGRVHAQVNIYMSGAASVKDVIYRTLTNYYGANLTSKNLDNASKPGSANRLTFAGQMNALFGNQTVNVFISYSGSGPAIQSLTQNTPVTFFASATQGVTNLISAPVDVGFSIVFQKDYPYPTPVLSDYTYGATPTLFVKSPLAPANLTNFTSQQLRLISANGSAPQSVFNGNPADTNVLYWIMRDIGAATRIISAKEAGYTGTQLAYAYSTNSSSWVLDSVGQPTWPLIVNMLTNNYGPCMSFITPPDGGSIQPQNFLRFNGFFPFNGTFSTATNDYSPVINGQYTCWGYEHVMTKPNPPTDISTFV
ncbi:MAG TPA: hypothetical protein VGR78_08570, partial [Verrucomicrobiae bacterium]|nr:hypothetical protein [Verrucomicrobiae bacterium]